MLIPLTIPKINKNHPTVCPHCNDNHGRLMIDDEDLYCIVCGYRDHSHFNDSLNKLIRRDARRDNLKRVKDKELISKEHARLYIIRNSKRTKELHKIWLANNKEHVKEYNAEYMKEYRINHRATILKHQRERRARLRASGLKVN